ncbi:MAG: BMP family ABC transporter substrate-binding protein [Caldiserica bacterium]|jgi:basic membrane protein A|nr:BMP family ABC transporter substrate-binding protein [Caldisericota bacterium]MDH7562810.1 BMP family ABC transporter substrate-binding protein [Caldisericota bacterium]
MKKFLIAVLTLALLLPPAILPVIAQPALSDISGHWAEATILKLVEKNYISGYPDGTFKPNNTITRAEFVKILTSVMGIAPATGGESAFSDVSTSDWFFGFVSAAVEKGIIGGYPDGTFRPNDPITREQAAKIVVLAKGIDPAEVDTEYVFEHAGNFVDKDGISDWAKPFVAAAVEKGIMKGDANNAFRATENITRAETAVIAYRVMPKAGIKVGLVTDVGGRGDKSFNDSALRGLEDWAAGWALETVPADLANVGITSLDVNPVIVESKANEDYVPNLTKMAADEKCDLVIAVGFMLTSAVQEVSAQFPDTKFMLIDGVITDENFNVLDPYPANVVSYTFKEHEGSFLVGALAGYMTKNNIVGFIGGMEVPIIKKFEAGYKAGVMTANPDAQVLVGYTGNFTSADDGKKLAVAQFGQNADIIFAAAGACGIGVIEAAKEKGEGYFAIGVDSDQDYMAPGRVLTSMIKHVDLAVWLACKSVIDGTFQGGIVDLGVKEGGVNHSLLTYTKDIIPQEVLDKVARIRDMIASGVIVVPDTLEKLAEFKAPAIP